MSSQDILNFTLALGFLVIAACIAVITYYLVRALKSFTHLSDSLEDTAQSIKSRFQLRALTLIPSLIAALVGRILKRGR